MSAYRELTFEEVLDILRVPEPTLILFHRNPDADAVGSAFAMREVLTDLGSAAYCVCQNEVPARLEFLSSGVQASVLPESIPAEFDGARVISVDTAAPNQLGTLWESFGGKVNLMIDHHGIGEPFADHYIRSGAAATGEILFDVVKELANGEEVTITDTLCTCLYAAISGDTGGFRFSNTSPETHQRAAELVASGIDCADINHKLFETKTMEQLRAEAAGVSNLHLFFDGRVAVVTFPYAIKAALGLSDDQLETLIEVARSLAGVKVAFAIRQPGTEGVFRVSARSACSYDVAKLCAQFGGGGHKKAAGCTLSAPDMEEAMRKLISAIAVEEL